MQRQQVHKLADLRSPADNPAELSRKSVSILPAQGSLWLKSEDMPEPASNSTTRRVLLSCLALLAAACLCLSAVSVAGALLLLAGG
jgi:hypothetical protein